MSRQLTVVVTVWQNYSHYQSRKRGKPEEHLKTGITSRAFLCLLASLSTHQYFTRQYQLHQPSLWQQTELPNTRGVAKWIIHNLIT